tara:strand:- start:3734 stop:4933 length:1200 start_codon:yes stop_codon:yes gene_type:complete
LENKLKKVLLKGPLLSNSGYGVHSRQVFEYLKTRKDIELLCDITSWGNTSWRISSYNDNSYKNIKDIIKSYASKSDLSKSQFDETYQVCFPNEWKKISDYDVGITAGIETTICSLDWISCINKMDKVIVPSEFSKRVFLNSSDYYKTNLNTEIIVIPEYYHEEFDLHEEKDNDFINEIKTSKNILISGQLTSYNTELDRKNIFNTIEYTIRELSNYEDYGLIIKTNLGKNNINDFLKLKSIMVKYYKELKKELKNIPNIYLLHGDMSPFELKTLYSSEKITAFVSCTRGEGFGLHMLEAAVCGLPIISTNWSAYTEFLDYFGKIKYKLVDIPESKVDNIFVKNSKWAEFDVDSFKENLNNFISYDAKSDKRIIDQKNNLINKMNKTSIISSYREELGRF